MLVQTSQGQSGSAHVVVLGNEKRGSGKSTVALHVAVALLKVGQRVATIDLDRRQQSFTRYIDNRSAWRAAPATTSSSRFTAASSLARPCRFWITNRRNLCSSWTPSAEWSEHSISSSSIPRVRHLPDASGALDGRYAGDADQGQLLCSDLSALHFVKTTLKIIWR
jgi:hypothetical protein